MFELNNFDSIQIGIASPEKIREWSYGEVRKPETINYRTQRPENDGLYCEKIFGPTKDWECRCGKYKRARYKGIKCDKCGVEVTQKKVRRERMGHIELASPVAHIWYVKGVPSRIGVLLDIGPKQLERVIYHNEYIVLDPGKTPLQYKEIISDTRYNDVENEYGYGSFKAGMGAEAIKELLMALDLDKESAELKEIVAKNNSGQKYEKAIKRLELVESFRNSGNRPEWMILDCIPVLPPDLRPMVALDGGRYATSDLNDLYRRVIMRNNRLKKMLEAGAPEIILKNEKRMLQQAVDSLIDNGKNGKPVSGASKRELKSLSGMLRGKQGRFRQNLLGKRVDYSGRSVIVVGPELKLYQCGLPKEMAIELFKPFVMKKLMDKADINLKTAKRKVEKMNPEVWDLLEEVIKDHPVLLNRAPTLHRLSIQAFEPVLIDGRAIKLHPLVCGAFNADFDGDQMAVHVPLSIEAQAEARFLMLASNNILKLSDGQPVMSPSQDMILGCYYLTLKRRVENGYYDDRFSEFFLGDDGNFYNLRKIKFVPSDVVRDDDGNIISATVTTDVYDDSVIKQVTKIEKYRPGLFTSFDEAIMAYQTKSLSCQDEIFVRRTVKTPDGQTVTGIIKTTAGRIIFNEKIPQNLGFVKREKPEDYLELEFNSEKVADKSSLKNIVDACFKVGGSMCAADTLDYIKSLGYKYSTLAAITTSVFDMHIPYGRDEIINNASKEVLKIGKKYERGIITDKERYNAVIKCWSDATEAVTKLLKKPQSKFNPIWMMANSGARGSTDQIKQLVGMRGLMSKPNGESIEIPVKSSFKEGLSVLEYFISSHGGRKGLADTAIKTADSGYLTRRLVDVSQEVIVREEDCYATLNEKPKGIAIRAIKKDELTGDDEKDIIESLKDRIIGRYTATDVVNPNTNEVIIPAGEMITEEIAKTITKAGIEEVTIRSVFKCKTKHGVCAKCYGRNMSNSLPVNIGEAVGIIAAQSIGEPGTQLTMRTFHSGGIASAGGDITLGLPRVEEIFEARKPKGEATVCEQFGTVSLAEKDGFRHVLIKGDDGKVLKDYVIPFSSQLLVKDGEKIGAGDPITKGPIYPQIILHTKGEACVQEYLIKQVQMVYRGQGVHINDKHIEIIVRQMLRKAKVVNGGNTELLSGELVDSFTLDEANIKSLQNGGEPANAKKVLLGITKAALATESFLSAASFQETSRVLTDAAIKNKIDPLIGLKENVIVGKLIPAGTGVRDYKTLNPLLKNLMPVADDSVPNTFIDNEDKDLADVD